MRKMLNLFYNKAKKSLKSHWQLCTISNRKLCFHHICHRSNHAPDKFAAWRSGTTTIRYQIPIPKTLKWTLSMLCKLLINNYNVLAIIIKILIIIAMAGVTLFWDHPGLTNSTYFLNDARDQRLMWSWKGWILRSMKKPGLRPTRRPLPWRPKP